MGSIDWDYLWKNIHVEPRVRSVHTVLDGKSALLNGDLQHRMPWKDFRWLEIELQIV